MKKSTKNRADHAGEVYGRLTLLRYSHTYKLRTYYEASCDCGQTKVVKLNALRTGNTKSCGCLKTDTQTTHGKSHHPLYATWNLMMSRCYNKNDKSFGDYGGRGITVTKRWHNIDNFIADMGERPKGKQLDRQGNDKGYSRSNCIWATPKENSQNKRNTVFVIFQNKKLSLADASRLSGINYSTLSGRIRRGEADPFAESKRAWK